MGSVIVCMNVVFNEHLACLSSDLLDFFGLIDLSWLVATSISSCIKQGLSLLSGPGISWQFPGKVNQSF